MKPRNMAHRELVRRGGAVIGPLGVSDPLAKLTVRRNSIHLSAFPWGTWTFRSNQVFSLTKAKVCLFFNSIRIRHARPEYSQPVHFVIYHQDPEELLWRIRRIGFEPSARREARENDELPVRWPFLVFGVPADFALSLFLLHLWLPCNPSMGLAVSLIPSILAVLLFSASHKIRDLVLSCEGKKVFARKYPQYFHEGSACP